MKKTRIVEIGLASIIIISYFTPFFSVITIDEKIPQSLIGMLFDADASIIQSVFSLWSFLFVMCIITIFVNSAKYPIIPFLAGICAMSGVVPIIDRIQTSSILGFEIGIVLMTFASIMLLLSPLLRSSWNYKNQRNFFIYLVPAMMLIYAITLITEGPTCIIKLITETIILVLIIGITILISNSIHRNKTDDTGIAQGSDSIPIVNDTLKNETEIATKRSVTCTLRKCKSKKTWITAIVILVIIITGIVICLNVMKPKSEVDYTLIPVRADNGLLGFMNINCETVIAPQFTTAEMFRCDLALVSVSNNGVSKYGFINKKGTLVIEAKYANASSFSDNVAWVVEAYGAPQAIDKNGKKLFELTRAMTVLPFSEGLAAFSANLESGRRSYGFVNKSGKVVIEPQYNSVLSFHEGMAAVINDQDKIGFIDKKGVLTIPFMYDRVKIPMGNIFMSNGQAVVKLHDKPVVIDRKGKHIIDGKFDLIIADGNGYMIAQEDQIGWCDKAGNIVIIPQFASARPFNGQKLAPASVDANQYGYINRDGVFEISPQFGGATCFNNSGTACVWVDYSYGLIDTKGNFLINPQTTNFPSELTESESLEFYSHPIYSDYVDIDMVINPVKHIFADNLFDGMKMGISIEQAINKYTIRNDVFDTKNTSYELCKKDITPFFTIYVKAEKEVKHHSRVSDGWWGYNNILNKATTLDNFILSLSLPVEYSDKTDYIAQKLGDALGVANYSGKIGEMYITIIPSDTSIDIYVGSELSSTVANKLKEIHNSSENPDFEEDVYAKYVYSGKIDDNYQIEMVLYRLDGNMYGEYRYMSNNKWITLKKINHNDSSSTVLEERVDSTLTGVFSGTLTDTDYSGTWVSANGTKSYPFSVQIVNE